MPDGTSERHNNHNRTIQYFRCPTGQVRCGGNTQSDTMTDTILIDPVTRLEGHYAVKVEVQQGRVSSAHSSGEMFRGFETILKGRHPMDAQQITQRICGVCPISHGTASILAQDQAYGVQPPKGGRLLRNLILGANYIQSHIVHFYQLSALDFIDVTAVLGYGGSDPVLLQIKKWINSQIESKTVFPAAPFLPRMEGDYISDSALNLGGLRHYVDALAMRAKAHQMAALFGGKVPHSTALVPGGVTQHVSADNIAAYAAMLSDVRTFIDTVYLPDVAAVAQAYPGYLEIGKGCGDFLAYGVFPEDDGAPMLPGGVLAGGSVNKFDPALISEDVRYSLFDSPSGLHPAQGQTKAAPDKADAYSWIKAPRYDGKPMEVGPLARMLLAYHQGHAQAKPLIDGLLAKLGLGTEALISVMGRHAARALECKIVADRCAAWLDELRPGMATFTDFQIPNTAQGMGLTEAPRGALGHWITIQGGRIGGYQCVVPSTWNCSPRDDKGAPGPVEQALVGTPIADPDNPLEAARVVRSFDPCLACAVH